MKPTVLTIGTFDGVHRGHQTILKRTVLLAKRLKCHSVALTFEQPPRLFFAPTPEPYLLTTVPEKLELLSRAGISQTTVFKFDSGFARVAARDFFEQVILGRFGARAVVVGYNFHFGRDREGSPEMLSKLGREYGVPVTIVRPFSLAGRPVSSGRVRELLKESKLKEAEKLLGHAYTLSGTVSKGLGLGRKLGFPTANIVVDPQKIVPNGVFSAWVWTRPERGGNPKPAICNVGVRPTVSRGRGERTVEAHLLGFKGSLYGRILKLELCHKIREERRFPGLEALRAQIAMDRASTEQFFSKKS